MWLSAMPAWTARPASMMVSAIKESAGSIPARLSRLGRKGVGFDPQ